MLQAIIYCRVSSEKQVTQGHGLDSQEKRCRGHAKSRGYKVIKIFREEGVSGKHLIRPEMENLIQYLSKNATKENPVAVIIDDLKRFGRETENHFSLKKRIYDKNGFLDSPSFRFEQNPNNKFLETMLEAHGTLEREENAIQVKNKMVARLESGYWTSKAPTGYKIVNKTGSGKILVIDETYGPVIKQALENFSNQIILTQIDFCNYLNKHGVKISTEGARGILKSAVYAGYLGGNGYTVTLRPAKHEGLINWSTYVKIQGLIKGKAKVIYHSDNATDFPLRNFIKCELITKN